MFLLMLRHVSGLVEVHPVSTLYPQVNNGSVSALLSTTYGDSGFTGTAEM